MIKIIFYSYIDFWLKATDFKTTTTRSVWWILQFTNLVISYLTFPVFIRIFGFNFYGLICILPQLAMDIRRIRDYGKNWKWIFINLLPILGWIIWFIWLGFGKTGQGKDRFI